MLHISSTSTDEDLCLILQGEVDAFSVESLRAVLRDAAGWRAVIVDLSEVPFMDSAGLGALIGGARRIREAGGDIAIVCSRPALTRLLDMTGFNQLMAVVDTVDEARLALTANG